MRLSKGRRDAAGLSFASLVVADRAATPAVTPACGAASRRRDVSYNPGVDTRRAYEQESRFLVELCTFLIPMIQTSTMILEERADDGTPVAGAAETVRIPFLSLLKEGLVETERMGASKARAGLRMAIQDMLETSRILTPAQVRELDGRLSSAGLPTLTAMRERVWRTLAKVMARGRCRTEAEYYLIVERLSNVDDETLSGDDRQTLDRIVLDFEERFKKRQAK